MRLIQSAHATMAPFVGSLDVRLSPALREDVSLKSWHLSGLYRSLIFFPPSPLYYSHYSRLISLENIKTNFFIHTKQVIYMSAEQKASVTAGPVSRVNTRWHLTAQDAWRCWQLVLVKQQL